MQKKKHKIILGPTAVGKSQYALSLKDFSDEIISADAFQVYKNFDIGTAKVSKSELKNTKHHLIDIKEADESYSAYEFCQRSESILKEKNKHFLIVGGTALYLHALLYQYKFLESPKIDNTHHNYWKELEEKKGSFFLWKLLNKIDSEAANLIHKNHKSRLIRALEIFETTGKKPSEFFNTNNEIRPDIECVGLLCSREALYTKINARVEKMIQNGWIEEVEELIKKHPITAQAFNAIGYKEIISFLNNQISKKTMIEEIKQKTRHFAKRQLTWFRKFPNVTWINVDF